MTVGLAVQLSETETGLYDPMKLAQSVLTGISTLAGQVILGKVLSISKRSKEQVAWLLAASVAVNTTVVVPLIVVLGRGNCVRTAPAQLSIAATPLENGGTLA